MHNDNHGPPQDLKQRFTKMLNYKSSAQLPLLEHTNERTFISVSIFKAKNNVRSRIAS